ncbi:hypothetical protein L249_1335, partial [Ophiocordyceps polyrhachis-furcata BCC 54312]
WDEGRERIAWGVEGGEEEKKGVIYEAISMDFVRRMGGLAGYLAAVFGLDAPFRTTGTGKPGAS